MVYTGVLKTSASGLVGSNPTFRKESALTGAFCLSNKGLLQYL